jgi:formylglycine-generating enzyme required for sulfatase activity
MRRLWVLLAVFALLSAALAREAVMPLAEAQTLPVGNEVTLKGPLLSTFHFKGPEADAHDPEARKGETSILVMYAFDGPPEVKAALEEVLDKYYPKEGSLDAEHALELQKQFDARLKYYVDAPGFSSKQVNYGDWVASATGQIQEKDGKKWLVNAKIAAQNNKTDFPYPPDCMLRPNKPFVMPKEQPVELKITDKLALKCVSIPPGTFIMGTPFYQKPRYQDECPHKVTLTKLYYMSEIPITQEMWEAVMGADKNVSDNRGPQIPAEFSPMPDIRQFCKILSEKNGRTVRLPTAAEMEYAARLGTSNPEFPEKNKDAWVMIGPPLVWKAQAAAVKTKPPNAWGLYDVFTEAKVAVSDWKAYNGPNEEVDPQGVSLEQSIVIKSVLKPKKPVANMIMKKGLPAIHKAVLGGGMKSRPGSHDRYTEDGCDGSNGDQWVGIFRIVVESGPAAAAPKP